jgi:uncharacterized membrane protein
MNPLQWNREHKAGLAIVTAIGFALGFLAGRALVEPYGHYIRYVGASGGLRWLGTYWFLVSAWGMAGALIAGSLAYAVRLLRS